jgi:hypothetical protein
MEKIMFMNRRVFVALAACLCVSMSTAFAGGGGGTKKDATIEIKNETADPIGVAINPSAKLLAAIGAKDLDAFKKEGGLIVNAGATVSVKVKSGTSRILVGEGDFTPIADVNKVVQKGKTLKGFVSAAGLNF